MFLHGGWFCGGVFQRYNKFSLGQPIASMMATLMISSIFKQEPDGNMSGALQVGKGARKEIRRSPVSRKI